MTHHHVVHHAPAPCFLLILEDNQQQKCVTLTEMINGSYIIKTYGIIWSKDQGSLEFRVKKEEEKNQEKDRGSVLNLCITSLAAMDNNNVLN